MDYPSAAAERQLQGYVVVEFMLLPNGKPSQPTVVEANPLHLFDTAAIEAVKKKWRSLRYQSPDRQDAQARPSAHFLPTQLTSRKHFQMARSLTMSRGQWLQIGATVLFATILTLLLVLGIRRASELQSTSTALQLASELSSRPELMRSELTLIQRGLETQTYIGQSLRNLGSMRDTTNQSYGLLQDALKSAKLESDTAVSQPLREAFDRWQSLDKELSALGKMRETELYTDSVNARI